MLKARVRRDTGRTRHYLGSIGPDGTLHRTPLVGTQWVVLHETESGVYYYLLDGKEEYITDGWHQTLDEAKRQAKFEFDIEATDWIDVGTIESLL